MWDGRFNEPPDPDFYRWQCSFPYDRRLLPEELAASRAYAEALARVGLLTAAEYEAIATGLARIGERAASDPTFLESDAEDVHHFVERRLVEEVGEVATKLHSGRSRNEQIATDLRLFVKKQIETLHGQLGDWIDVLLDRAEELQDVAMPGYTHGQRAEPILGAHWLLAYAEMFFRDLERLHDCHRRADVLPLGSGALGGSYVPVDRAALAHRLGFAAISANSLDATSDRDFVLEFLFALSLIGLHLSRWASEAALFASAEFGFLKLPDAYATGSSLLPQKKNPDALELLRAKAGRIFGALTALYLALKGLPLGYSKDLQEDKEPLFDACDTVASALAIATGFLRSVEFDTGRMRHAAEAPYLNAAAAASYLAHRGVPFREAHERVGRLVQHCLAQGIRLEEVPLEQLRGFSREFDHDVYASLTLEAVLAAHEVPGGTAPARVHAALREAKNRLAQLREATHARA
ncbi:MAG: argininosuccinate lyase [Acidobacteria bacterium]|nr:argininosuccinate lyase [Acidobacteriota bacterium]